MCTSTCGRRRWSRRCALDGKLDFAVDAEAFRETSSYGPRAVDAVVRVTGIDVLVHGSDRPYAIPAEHRLGAAAHHALRTTNPHRLPTPKGDHG